MESTKEILPGLGRVQILGLAAAVAGVLMFGIGMAQDRIQAWESYLAGFWIFLALTFGCLAMTILKHVTRGKWGNPVIRFWEAGAMLMPLMFLLSVPILMNLGSIYGWARPEDVAHSELLKHKSPFLDPTFFTIRIVIYFALWSLIAFVLRKWSDDEDRTGDPRFVVKKTNFAAPAAVLFVLLVTFAATDLVMSLEEHWFSTIFGLLTVVGSALFATALATAILVNISNRAPYNDFLTQLNWRDLGNLLLTMVILWAYMSFSQFLIIWAGNLPEEITYYAVRKEGIWQYVGTALVWLHFFLPFFLLLSSRLKRTPVMLGGVAIFIIVMRIVDLLWAVVPSQGREGLALHWMDLAAILAIGGLWVFGFTWLLSSRRLLPRYTFAQPEVVEHA